MRRPAGSRACPQAPRGQELRGVAAVEFKDVARQPPAADPIRLRPIPQTPAEIVHVERTRLRRLGDHARLGHAAIIRVARAGRVLADTGYVSATRRFGHPSCTIPSRLPAVIPAIRSRARSLSLLVPDGPLGRMPRTRGISEGSPFAIAGCGQVTRHQALHLPSRERPARWSVAPKHTPATCRQVTRPTRPSAPPIARPLRRRPAGRR